MVMSKDMERWLDMQDPALRKSVTVVDVERPLLHISSNNNIRKFTPMLPRSTYVGENVTVPRVCVSQTIMDTIIGASWNFEVLLSHVDYKATCYTIYSVYSEEAIRPTKKLTQEGSATGELWIVPYKLSMYDITPEKMACMSLSTVENTSDCVKLEFVINVHTPVYLTNDQLLDMGYYNISGIKLSDVLGKSRDISFTCNKISRDAYLTGAGTLRLIQ